MRIILFHSGIDYVKKKKSRLPAGTARLARVTGWGKRRCRMNRGGGCRCNLALFAVTDTEEDALEDIQRVEAKRIGQFAYRATCRGIDGYFDGFHHAREKDCIVLY